MPVYTICCSVTVAILFAALTGCDNTSVPDSSQPSTKVNQVDSRELELFRFEGICDGSAVVQLPNKNLLVAYDEENTLYEFSASGGAILNEYPYGRPPVATSAVHNPEVDVEGAVAVKPYLWWVGSHGNDGRGRPAPNRQQLFRAIVSADSAGQTRVEVLKETFDLLPTLLTQGKAAGLLNESMLKRKPKKGGINIEGLSVLDNGNLLLGLRSPLTDQIVATQIAAKKKSAGDDTPDAVAHRAGSAIAAEVDVSALPPRVTGFHLLDLDNRGIRDLYATDTGFVVIAGDVASGGRFSIYRWAPGSQPRRLLDLPAHFNAEAIIKVQGHWLVFSDDGKVKRHEESAADGDRQCDAIRRNNPMANRHPSVFFRALVLNEQLLQ